jgi:hypothetical protein
MTRPGRVCRECEQERTLARSSSGSPAGFAPVHRSPDEALADPGIAVWASQLRARPVLLAGAFVVGIAAAAAVYAINGLRSEARHESVMIDRDLSAVRARHFHRASDPAPSAVVTVPSGAGVTGVKAARPSAGGTGDPLPRPRPVEHVASAAERAPATYDRVLGLADALDGCSHESFFARLACEGRARAQYCDGAGGRIPQCAEPAPREYGQ